jgi:hypothetical protein
MKPSAGCVAAALILACWSASSGAQMQSGDEPAAAEQAVTGASGVSSSYPWPYQFSDGGVAFTVYPPQLERWQAERLEGQAAVAARGVGADKPVFGVVSLSARTESDANGLVKVRDIVVSRASFPTAGADARGYLDAVRRHLASVTWTVARERLDSDLAVEHVSREAQAQPVRNAPPRIYYSESPAILVPVDGTPQLKELAGLDLSRVINTRALILQDRTSRRYYLFVAGRWMEAAAIEGPWTESQVRPSVLEEAKEQAQAAGQVDLVEGSESAGPLEVFVATGPAELVQTDGPAQYLPVPKTNLLYVTNTPNRLFLDVQTQKYYVLLAGRWYRAASLTQGPWEYVAGTSLPPDFALIPDNHPAEGVRASVPGTAQAQEAVIANGVPQMATVKRSAATLEITYDGTPQFRAIEGTPLQYAVNAPMPVIQVDANSFYALDNGVWFVAPSAFGPWSAAAWVPPVIYSIPRSSPLHYVTYVRVYDATPDAVYEGYTPGYVGSYVAPGATVVYGTGWYYQPWVGSVWYPPPCTWGFGFSVYNTWWSPWPWQPWWWVGWGPYPWFRPWWGPWAVPVAVVPVFVPHRPPVVLPHPGRVWGRGTTTNIHTRTPNMANVFGRWGTQVARPLGPSAGGLPDARRLALNTPQQPMRAGALPAVAQPGSSTPRVGATPWREAPSTNGAAGGSAASPQVFRRQGGQWQQFQGNGQWQNVNASGPGGSSRPATQPQLAQSGEPRIGTPAGGSPTSGMMGRGPVRTAPNQPTPPSVPRFAGGVRSAEAFSGPTTQSARPGGPTAPRVAAPQTRPFVSGRAQAIESFAGNESPPMGRAGGGWTPNQGGAAGTGRAMGAGRPGGMGRGWGASGGRASGSAIR